MKTRRSTIARLAFVICIGTAWGCGSRTVSRVPAPPASVTLPPEPSRAPVATGDPLAASASASQVATTSADCGLFPGQSESTDAISTVGLSERVDPTHAPHPTNESERLLFRQLYETLIRVDCQGHASPGLAASWRPDTSRNIWIVTLRSNARFSDNTLVTASDVVSSWMNAGTGRGNDSELRPEVGRLVRSIAVVDDHTLEIDLQSRRADAILALAHTDLAIATPVPGFPGFPLGTRPARIEAVSSSVITLTLLSENSSVRFLIAPGSDSRDLLDRGVDLLLTRDPRTLDYAATLPQFQTVPMPWQRTIVLVAPGNVRTTPSLSPEDRRLLAQDAVRGEARGAEGPFWWESLSGCDIAPSHAPTPTPSATPRIVYDADDSAARELAERFVGIGKYPRASGLAAEALAQALRRGNESGYVLSLDRRPFDPCREMQFLADHAGWIDPQTIVPLVDTRLQAIVRRGRSGLISEWDGALLLLLMGGNGR
jgi:hypothetical protein